MDQANPYAAPAAEVADVTALEASPQLWNPNAAASWSLLFSPVFGAWLHMLNWRAMGEHEKAAASQRWIIGSFVVLVLLVIGAVALPDTKALDGLSRAIGFGVLIAWYYAIGKSQNAAVLARYGKGYNRKGWSKPLLLALAGFVGLMVLGGVMGFVYGMVAASQ